MNTTVKRFFQLERAVSLLMTASPHRRMRFLGRLEHVGIAFTKKVLIDHATGVVVQRHDAWSPVENMIWSSPAPSVAYDTSSRLSQTNMLSMFAQRLEHANRA